MTHFHTSWRSRVQYVRGKGNREETQVSDINLHNEKHVLSRYNKLYSCTQIEGGSTQRKWRLPTHLPDEATPAKVHTSQETSMCVTSADCEAFRTCTCRSTQRIRHSGDSSVACRSFSVRIIIIIIIQDLSARIEDHQFDQLLIPRCYPCQPCSPALSRILPRFILVVGHSS